MTSSCWNHVQLMLESCSKRLRSAVCGRLPCNKISKATASPEYVQCKRNIKIYLDNIQYHTQCERAGAIENRKAAAVAALVPYRKEPFIWSGWTLNSFLNFAHLFFFANFWSSVVRPVWVKPFMLETAKTRLLK